MKTIQRKATDLRCNRHSFPGLPFVQIQTTNTPATDKINTIHRYREIIDNIKIYIRDNLDEPLCTCLLAEQACMNKSSFQRIFKQISQQTVQDYIETQRIEQVQIKLTNTDKSIHEISMETGFSNQAYLTNVFKKRVGIPPTKYRKQERSAIE